MTLARALAEFAAGPSSSGLARGGFTGPAPILGGRLDFYHTFLGAGPDPARFDTLALDALRDVAALMRLARPGGGIVVS